jgi:NAD(P)-dependent dehydrogenase (short-subunit alcohol dehydrogenase family)
VKLLLAGKDIAVTGAAAEKSIGDAIARRIAEHGGHIHILSRSAKSADTAATRLKKDGFQATGHACELTNDESVKVLARHLTKLDGIVHNAGHPVTLWDRPFADVPMEDYRAAFEVDVLGAARLSRAFLPRMKEAGSGSLVFTSSTAAIAGYEFLHEFSPAKAGVLGLMRSLAAEFGRHGIRSNAVAYGNIASPATWDALDADARDTLAQESPMRRWGQPREAAGASVFLLSDLASFVNGQTLIIDGGTVMK